MTPVKNILSQIFYRQFQGEYFYKYRLKLPEM